MEKSKGTILYIGFFSLPDKNAAANRVMNNAKLFKLLGYDVVFIDEQDNYSFKDIFSSKREINGFTIYSQKKPTTLKEYLNKAIKIKNIEMVFSEIKNPKMIIAYNYPAIALFKLFKLFNKKVKICSDCTEWYSGSGYKFPKNILSKLDSFFRMRIIQKKLDGIICISSYLDEYYKRKVKTVIIPPLVDIEDKIWNQDKYKLEGINFIYSGSPGADKDIIKPIVQVISGITEKKIKFRIVGVTKEEYLKLNPKDLKYINNNIVFLGKVSHSESIKLIKSSNYFIFLRKKNRVSMAGFSTKFVEAMTNNLYIITTNTSDIEKYIHLRNKGVILEDISKLKEKILEIIIKEEKINLKEKKEKICDIFYYKKYEQVMKEFMKKVYEEE